mgnify:FL=1
MPKVVVDTPAPQFSLQDYHGQTVSLSDFKEQSNILLVFNRTFA